MTTRLAWPRHLVACATAALLGAVPASAQGRPLSVWLGAGRPVSGDSISTSLLNLDAYGGVQLDVPLLPVALRADVSFGDGDLRRGARTASVSAVFPLRLPILQPYAMLGYGTYGWGQEGARRGLSVGAGARLHLGAFGAFAQVRHHDVLDRSIGTVGLIF